VRTVFFGSGSFAIPSFEALLDAGHQIAALVTQPDRSKGRGQAPAPPPLKPVAQARGIAALQPLRVRDETAVRELRALGAELHVVVAYGQILPRAVLDIPPRGTLNLHGSLLPAYRGAAPVQWAIVNGESHTGVTTMLLDEGLDTGPVLLARSTPIGPAETAAELGPRLARLGAPLLVETMRELERGTLKATPQDPSRATLAPLIRKRDGRIDWSLPAEAVARRVRGFHPWPGAWTTLDGRMLKVLRARVSAPGARDQPGAVTAMGGEGIEVACGTGTSLTLIEVQPESRRPMTAAAFAAGRRLLPGARFDPPADPT
jgi:methionyl-tRNA formyltransferase